MKALSTKALRALFLAAAWLGGITLCILLGIMQDAWWKALVAGGVGGMLWFEIMDRIDYAVWGYRHGTTQPPKDGPTQERDSGLLP